MTRVVVGLDASPESSDALAWAVDYAERAGARLQVVTVVPPLVTTALWNDLPLENTADAHVEGARIDVDRMLRRCELERESPITCPVDVVAYIGHPVTVLVKHSEGAEVVVVGSRRPGIVGRAVGSVSDAVAHHARCPVVVVRHNPARQPALSS